MIASLQMYDWPELEGAYRIYWSLIRDRLRGAGLGAPDELTRLPEESSAWLRSDLVLSQTCGMPYRLRLHDKVALVCTPNYALTDCPPGYYRSAFVVRRDDPRRELQDFAGATFAFNNRYSQSGYAAAYFHTAELGFWFEQQITSGGHKESARLVASRKADVASLDAVSWRFMERYDAFAEKLRVVAWTRPTPSLPYISAKGADRERLFEAIRYAMDKLPTPEKSLLGFQSLVHISKQDYLEIPNP